MRIASLLVVLVIATTFLSGCQHSKFRARRDAALDREALRICALPVYAQEIAAMCSADKNRGLLGRIRGRDPRGSCSGGGCKTGIETYVNRSPVAPVASICASCAQPMIYGCSACVDHRNLIPTESAPKLDAKADHIQSSTESQNGIVPLPPSYERARGSDAPSVMESGQEDLDPTLGVYEQTTAPEFVAVPQILNEEDETDAPDSTKEPAEPMFSIPVYDDDPMANPEMPEIPDVPAIPEDGDVIEKKDNLLVFPASSRAKNRRKVSPPSYRTPPDSSMKATPVEKNATAPVKDQVAADPDRFDEISNQIAEISKQVAEISSRVAGNNSTTAQSPETNLQSAESSTPITEDVEKPIILKARPSESFYFNEQRVVAANQPARARQPLIPIYNASHHAINNMALPHHESGFRALPQMETTNFSSPAVAKRAQSQAHLRFESEAKRAQEQMFNIQAIIRSEIDRRVQRGELVSPSQPPQVHPKSMIQSQPEQTANNNAIPVLQVGQPRVIQQESDVSDGGTGSISPPLRRPAAPVKEFEAKNSEEFAIDYDWNAAEPGVAAPQTPNLIVPVLKAQNQSSQPIQTQASPQTIENANTTNGIQGTIKLDIEATPISNGATINRRRNQLQSTENQDAHEGVNEILRLRATSNPAVAEDLQPLVKFRKASTRIRYQQPRYQDEPATPIQGDYRQQPVYENSNPPGTIEIETIKAQPIHDNEALQREIRGLTELPGNPKQPSAARIIGR